MRICYCHAAFAVHGQAHRVPQLIRGGALGSKCSHRLPISREHLQKRMQQSALSQGKTLSRPCNPRCTRRYQKHWRTKAPFTVDPRDPPPDSHCICPCPMRVSPSLWPGSLGGVRESSRTTDHRPKERNDSMPLECLHYSPTTPSLRPVMPLLQQCPLMPLQGPSYVLTMPLLCPNHCPHYATEMPLLSPATVPLLPPCYAPTATQSSNNRTVPIFFSMQRAIMRPAWHIGSVGMITHSSRHDDSWPTRLGGARPARCDGEGASSRSTNAAKWLHTHARTNTQASLLMI